MTAALIGGIAAVLICAMLELIIISLACRIVK